MNKKTIYSKDPSESAEEAGLRYVCENDTGIRRRAHGKGFVYLSPSGKKIKDSSLLKRIESLVIPPAWTDVWICATSNGHIQATGRDAKARKQFIYHPKWNEIRNKTKFERMLLFAKVLPRIRTKVEKHLRMKRLSRRKILAVIVRLLEQTLIRVGNEEYALSNKSYGLTTLKNKHLQIKGSIIKFQFRGKSGKQWEVDIQDKRIAKVLKECQELPGQELFQYIDLEGNRQNIDSSDVNEYLRRISKHDLTAKDFRTWGGTVLLAKTLYQIGPFETKTQGEKNIRDAIKLVSSELNNTCTICRKYYLHPAIFESYRNGVLLKLMDESYKKARGSSTDLTIEEFALMALLQKEM